MRRSLALPLAAAALATAAALPASAPAATWTAARAATSAGSSFGPAVAADAHGRLALAYVRQLGGENRAEVRRGTTRAGLRGAAAVLDRSRHAVFAPALGLPADGGPLAFAWLHFADRAHRALATTIDDAGRAGPARAATPEGTQSAYAPAFVHGADRSLRLVWTRRTTQAGLAVDGAALGAPFALPGAGVGSQPQVAVDADGTTVVVWLDTAGGRLLGAQAPAGGTFGPTTVLSGPGRARDPQLTVSASGDVVAAWLSSAGSGNAVMAAVRPRRAAFGAPFQVAEPAQRAFAPRLVATPAGEVLVAWVNSNVTRAFGGASGIVRAQRLRADGTLVGPRLRLSPNGVRSSEPALVSDAGSAAFAAWTDFRSGRGSVQARRIAPGGIVGTGRTLSRRGAADNVLAPVLAGAAGRVAAVWVQRGDVAYSLYR